MKFRKKPVVVEAHQFNEDWSMAHFEFQRVVKKELFGPTGEGGYRYYIETLEGNMAVNLDDWIIQGVNGEFYPCKPDIFEKTYEPVEGEG